MALIGYRGSLLQPGLLTSFLIQNKCKQPPKNVDSKLCHLNFEIYQDAYMYTIAILVIIVFNPSVTNKTNLKQQNNK